MNLWSTVILILFLIWGVICQQWYVCGIKQKCDDAKPVVAEQPVNKRNLLPIVFNYKSDLPIVNDSSFAIYRQNLLSQGGDNDMLIVEGQYFDGETEKTGLARAEAIQKMFLDSLSTERLDIRSRQIRDKRSVDTSPFEASQLFWQAKPDVDTVATADGDEDDKKVSKVEELPDRERIYHLYNSTERTIDPDVDAYLAKLVKRVKQTGESIELTGHTDNKGDDAYNMKLGRERARFIKELLVEKGVDAAKISVRSKGESEPIASNDTDEGRSRNRRTELVLNRN